MSAPPDRRSFLQRSALLGLGMAALPRAGFAARASKAARPVVIASANGFWTRNGGPMTGVETAFQRITAGADVLDAVIAGANIPELDPEDYSVGYGGLPNADGVVQLDSCCMHGPTRRAGGVAALEGVRTPSLVAKAVLQETDHHLLVGAGAQWFARNLGFTIETDLNTPFSRNAWLEWKRFTDPGHFVAPPTPPAAGPPAGRAKPSARPAGDRPKPSARPLNDRAVMLHMVSAGLLPSTHTHGTINCLGVNTAGEISGVTTTSGLAWKIPGRVGDSPILGAGLYVDGAIGAAGSTGRGEANLYGLCSFLIVENLRRGLHPKDAGMEALRRVKENTIAPRLRKPNGDPNFNLLFYVLNTRGEHAGVSLYGEDDDEIGWAGQTGTRFVRYSCCDGKGPRFIRTEALLPGTPLE